MADMTEVRKEIEQILFVIDAQRAEFAGRLETMHENEPSEMRDDINREIDEFIGKMQGVKLGVIGEETGQQKLPT